MGKKLNNILNGWTNYLIGGDQANKTEAERRAKICNGCDVATYGTHTAILPDYSIKEIQGMYCSEAKGGCGCPLSPAVRSKDYQCPLGKWEEK